MAFGKLYMLFIFDPNYPIIIFTIINLLIGLALLAKSSENKNSTFVHLILFQFIFGIIITISTGIAQHQSGVIQADTRDTVNYTSNLSREIKRLQEANNSLSSNIEKISGENQKLANQIKDISSTSKELINNINSTTLTQLESNASIGTLDFTFDKPVNTLNDITLLLGIRPQPATEYPLETELRLGTEKDYTTTNPIRLQVINKKLVMNVNLRDFNNYVLFEIKNNSWIVNPIMKYKLNYDSKGFEIIDSKDNILFSIDIRRNNTIKIQCWYPVSPNSIRVVGDVYKTILGYGSQNENLNSYFKQLFEYSGANWLHKRVKN